ncbi:putative inactive purple acid phosphatase 27 [Glycine max]|nr:putative inactive purple acid phosphatase 27 [Glycine max]
MEEPETMIAIHIAVVSLHSSASITATPSLLGKKYINLSTCDSKEVIPYICSAPIKPKLVAVSNFISFVNPKVPLYPRLAQGKSWDEMTVTWTSGYDINEAIPFVEWGPKGSPAQTVGWRDHGFIHTSFLKNLWPNLVYATDYGMFRFCIADTEHDWREGSEQYKFIEHCLATVDRQKQPWLIFAAHRVLGYSSDFWYGVEGSFEEPSRYSGVVNGTIHVVAGGAGSHLSNFSQVTPKWSLYRDYDFGFVKLTAFDHSSLLFEYKKSSDGKVYDSFTISRDYKDVLACVDDSCEATTSAT